MISVGVFFNPHLVVGGDLNFTLSLREVWGANPKVDPQRGFFLSFLKNARLVDLEPIKLAPTWRNFKTEDEEVEKRLYPFLVLEALLEMSMRLKSSVEIGVISHHRPISLQWQIGFDSPPTPLKFS